MSKQTWKDTLPVVDAPPTLRAAARYLTDALAWSSSRDRGVSAGWAAAHIRAYRKSLGVKSERLVNVFPDDEGLLWSALEAVSIAATFDTPERAARWCRAAEADLRELWKRGQA